jgi:hypothetical protein
MYQNNISSGLNDEISLFPNPVKDNLLIKFPSYYTNLVISNILSKEMSHYKLKDSGLELSVSGLKEVFTLYG